MNLNVLLIPMILLIYLTSNTYALPCKESDYKQYFSDCDSKEETRTVTIHLSTECEINNSAMNVVLSIYSTQPTYTIPCSTKCKPGEYVFFDVIKKEATCSKCPEDTYSQGGDFKISSNWNQEAIKKHFITNCYAIDSFSFKKNEDCSQFTLLNDKSMFASGKVVGQQIKYLFELIYFFKSRNNGRLILKYKKDTITNQGFNNGELRMFFDYESIGAEDNASTSNTSLKTVYHDYGPGEHELVMFYNYYRMNNKELKLYIQSIEVIGMEEASYQCEKCINSIAPPGSEQCISCKDNHYFDKASNECKMCSIDEFSITNSNTNNSCKKRRECSEYDYELTKVNQCLNKKRIVELSLIKPVYCLNKSNTAAPSMTKEVSCINQDNSGSNNTNPSKCSEGRGLLSYYQMDFSKGKISDLFTYNSGWSSNGNKLFAGTYLTETNDKILKLQMMTNTSFALARIGLEIKLSSNEVFKIKVNNEIVKVYSNVTRIETIEVPLVENNNNLEFLYQKSYDELLFDNPVSITKIELFGTTLSTNQICHQCPNNLISPLNSNSCQKCKETEIPNAQQSVCVQCPNGISQTIDGKLQCSTCPSFTTFNGKKCVLNELILQQEHLLKFNLAPMKDWINNLCTDQSGVLCYENSFIGPVNSKSFNSTSNDIFFISLFEPKAIHVNDFAYDDNTNVIKEGHIFGLFSVNTPILGNSNLNTSSNNNNTNTSSSNINPNDHNDLFIDYNITYKNTKTKKNIAKSIKQVHLLGQSINESKRLGAIIEYEQGDTCINDQSKKYKTYTYLKCDKYQISSPKLINTKDNGCTLVFEWGSPYLCKNCLTREITNFEKGACRNKQRQIIFSSNDDCLIFNATDQKLLGDDKEYKDELLNENDTIYQLVINDKRDLGEMNVIQVKNSNSLKFPFVYIESKSFYQKCSFIDNISDSWKKYLLLIPIIYVMTCVLIIFYCCKYRKIKNEYERLRNLDMSNQDIGKEKDGNEFKEENTKKDDKQIEIKTS